jgi:hypothetical protein
MLQEALCYGHALVISVLAAGMMHFCNAIQWVFLLILPYYYSCHALLLLAARFML